MIDRGYIINLMNIFLCLNMILIGKMFNKDEKEVSLNRGSVCER